MRTTRTTSLLLVLSAWLLAACINPFGQNAKELAAESTSDLLVPDDSRFADNWEFTIEESADNYTFRSNWDPEYNPDVDKESTVTGFQINSPDTWTGEADAETADFADAMRGLPADAADRSGTGPCRAVESIPSTVRCRYDLGEQGDLTTLVRQVDNGRDATLVVVYDDAGTVSEDFLAGSFRRVPIDEATDSWLTGS